MNKFSSVLTIAAALIAAQVTTLEAQLQSTLVVSGLSTPVALVQDPSQPTVQVVVEQGGRIRIVQNGVLLPTDFLDLTPVVLSGGEQGLLGLAFAPDYATSRRFYVNFTNLAGDTVIARFLRSTSDPLRADPASRFDLVWPGALPYIEQPFANHNGGDLHFGPDGFLYIGMGDGGSGNDPQHRAQDPSTLLGKMLRIDVSVALTHPTGYVVPPGNPFVGQAGVLSEIWAFGYRNPWRFSFDDPARGGTGAMVVGDVGQGTREEIDYEPAGRGGRNYGWRNREGTVPNIGTLPPFSQPLTEPLYDYGRTEGQVVTGGFVYRGSALGATFAGRYFFADLGSSRAWSLGLAIDPVTGEATVTGVMEHTSEIGRAAIEVSSFGVDAAGELYTVGYGTGEIHRITRAPDVSSCTTVRPASDWVCVNGGWLPPGLTPPSTPPPTVPPPTPPPSGNCPSVQPAADWICVNGGWLPPGLAPPPTSPPTTPPPTTPTPTTPPVTGCTTVQPAPDWVCVNGGWLPPGLVAPSVPTAPPLPPPTPTGCSTPDPFIGIPGLAGICSNGGWVPTELVQTGATVEFRSIEGGFWIVRLDDGRVFLPKDGLATEFRTDGRRVTLTGKVRTDMFSIGGPVLEILQIQ